MTNITQIRPAAKDNQPAIKQLIREGGINPLGIDYPRFLVAVDAAGTVVGCGQVKEHGDGSRELASIVVTRDWRGRGIAGELIQALQEKHGSPLWLTCMDRLVPFYQPFGFTQITSGREMPPYFRRAVRLFKLYQALTRHKGILAVMVWPGAEE